MKPLDFVYLTSSPFSGSTLFARLANMHPDIATVGEMSGVISRVDPETYTCSCGKRIKVCGFWLKVAEYMASCGQKFDPGNFDTKFRLDEPAGHLLHVSLPCRALEDLRDKVIMTMPSVRLRVEYLLERNKCLAHAILAASGKSIFFDASKTPELIRFLLADRSVNLRVVHLVRDVRAVSFSRQKNQGALDWSQTVAKWIRMNRSIERQLTRLPRERWIRIRYEDLCSSTQTTMSRFFSFCGARSFQVPTSLEFGDHHIVGNRMRLSRVSEIRVDDKWRRELRRDQRMLASRLAARYQARYGYSID
jgi:hypothetical protein